MPKTGPSKFEHEPDSGGSSHASTTLLRFPHTTTMRPWSFEFTSTNMMRSIHYTVYVHMLIMNLCLTNN